MAILHRFHGECSVDSVARTFGHALKHGAMVQRVVTVSFGFVHCAYPKFVIGKQSTIVLTLDAAAWYTEHSTCCALLRHCRTVAELRRPA